ncbi:unnamed protein product [Effrenium voratum]|nr:unnamed protein product [Effrenium voratum]
MFDKIQTLLEEVNLYKDGKLLPAASKAFWCCDEKGLVSNEGKIKFQRVVAPRGLPQATTDIGSASFGHVTLLPFVSVGGDVGPANIIMSGTSRMKAWDAVWPSANIAATEHGSCTAKLFTEFVVLWEKHCRDVLKVPREQQLVLLCDSGGGSLIHMSVELTLVAHQLGIRLCILGPYLTRALMPLDQLPNAAAERAWENCRRQGSASTHFEALDCAHEVWSAGYCEKNILSGWKQTGFVLDCAISRNTVLVTRHQELFRKVLSKEEMDVEQAESKLLLARPTGYRRAPQTATCSECQKQCPTAYPKCPWCGKTNSSYNEIRSVVSAGARAGGYTRTQQPLADVDAVVAGVEPAAKAHISKFCGDVLGEMRKRKKADEDKTGEGKAAPAAPAPATPALATPAATPAPATPAPATPVPATPAPATPALKKPKPGSKEEGSSSDDLDLDDGADVITYILSHWKESQRKAIEKIVKFYVQDLQKKGSKASPLSSLVRKEIIATRVLMKKSTREGWLKCWEHNRSLRYVCKPKLA